MLRVFEGQTANEAWLKLASAFCAKESTREQSSRCGTTLEIPHAAISITEPRHRWVISRNPPLNVAFAIAETIWIMAGRNDAAFLNYFNNGLPKYAGSGPAYHGAYGRRLRRHFGIDQFERAYKTLSHNPDSRQVVLQIWDGTVDLPDIKGQPISTDVPCNIISMLKVRNSSLEWTQIMRSNDVFRGLPYNLVQFTTMQEIMAGWLGLKVGTYTHFSDSLHVYDSDKKKLESSSQLIPCESLDSLALPKEEFDTVFRELEKYANTVTNEGIDAEMLAANVRKCKLPTAYRNALCVVCAEGVRRRNCPHLISEIMANCTNALFHQLYERWLSRFFSKGLKLAYDKRASVSKTTLAH